MTPDIGSLDDVIALLKEGRPLRAALGDWAGASATDRHRRLGRMLALGAAPDAAIARTAAFGEETDAVVAAIRIHLATGASATSLLSAAVSSARRRLDAAGAAGAGSAGALLSARLIAALPLAFVPFVPAAKAPLFDARGSGLLVLGIALCLAGFRWVSALVPRPPRTDAVAETAYRMAAVLRAEASLRVARELAGTGSDETEGWLRRAGRRASLGASAGASLSWAGSPLEPIGRLLELTYERGSPPAPALEELAESRRAAAERSFETSLRRAPVLMVLPVTLCVLPAYVLLGLVPFVRGSLV